MRYCTNTILKENFNSDVILMYNTIVCHKVSKFTAEITELIFFEKLVVNIHVEALKQNKNKT